MGSEMCIRDRCRLATPITVKFEQLRPGEGYDPKKETPNFGPVWEGGEWHLRDITNHMTSAAFFLLKHAAQNREHWLERFYEIGKDAVRPRQNGELFGFVILPSEDWGCGTAPSHKLADILERGGVELAWARGLNPFLANGVNYPRNSRIVRMDQPYAGFAKALLEDRRYPDLRDSTGRPIPPYDVTAHSLTRLLRVEARTVFAPFKYPLPGKGTQNFPGDSNACGSAPLAPNQKAPAIYKSDVPSMDRGWTQWVFDNQRRGYRTIQDKEIQSGRLFDKYSAIIIPDQPRAAILNGHRKGAMPEEYTGGLGTEGVKALREFVEQGGTLVCLNRASDFAIEQFKLPVRDVTDGLPRTDFYVPGSILRIELDTTNAIAKGMPKESIAWVENSPVFEVSGTGVSPVDGDTGKMPVPRVKVIAWYPKDRDPLLSGWLLGGERIKGKAALVEVGMGKGRIILFGFRPQYRGQSLATYPLFFNAITGR